MKASSPPELVLEISLGAISFDSVILLAGVGEFGELRYDFLKERLRYRVPLVQQVCLAVCLTNFT